MNCSPCPSPAVERTTTTTTIHSTVPGTFLNESDQVSSSSARNNPAGALTGPSDSDGKNSSADMLAASDNSGDPMRTAAAVVSSSASSSGGGGGGTTTTAADPLGLVKKEQLSPSPSPNPHQQQQFQQQQQPLTNRDNKPLSSTRQTPPPLSSAPVSCSSSTGVEGVFAAARSSPAPAASASATVSAALSARPLSAGPAPSSSATTTTTQLPLVNGKDRLMSSSSSSPSPSLASVESNRPNGEHADVDDEDKKLHINNNTNAYVSGGGRLKIFKEGHCIVELTHRDGERGNNWLPTSKKVYWPPQGGPTSSSTSSAGNGGTSVPSAGAGGAAANGGATVKIERCVDAHSASDSASIADGSSIPSPWGVAPLLHHRAKSQPKRLLVDRLPAEDRHALLFSMRPTPGIASLRRKNRKLKRKSRRPYDEGTVSSLWLQMESRNVTQRPKPRPFMMDRIRQSSRIEAIVTKVQRMPKQPKKPLVQIQTWGSSHGSGSSRSITMPNEQQQQPRQQQSSKRATQSANSSSSASASASSSASVSAPGARVTRVKSELFPVTETCTAATLPNSSPSHHRNGSSKSKSHAASTADSPSHASQRLSFVDGKPVLPSVPLSTATAKTLPITPTMARIKSSGQDYNKPLVSSSLISPDLQRVKVEIGASPGSHHHLQQLHLQQQQLQHQLQQQQQQQRSLSLSNSPMNPDNFISPRKRLIPQTFENGVVSPLQKKQRLSTDSRGSAGSSDGGTNSPAGQFRPNCQSPANAARASPFNQLGPAVAASPPRSNGGGAGGKMSSFSIDSIINKSSPAASPGPDVKPIVRPVAVPASPARSESDGGSVRNAPPSPTQVMAASSVPSTRAAPLQIPIVPYTSRGLTSNNWDRKLLHMAGVSADPRLGLNPVNGGNSVPGASTSNPFPPAAAVVNPYYQHQLLAAAAAASQQQQQQHAALASHLAAAAAASSMYSPAVSSAQSAAAANFRPPSPPKRPKSPSQPTPNPRSHLPVHSSVLTSSSLASSPLFSFGSMLSNSSRNATPPGVVRGGGLTAGSSWPPQYRGEPRVDTPERRDTSSPDAPLNLSTKR